MNSPKIRIAVLDSNPKSRKYLVKLIGNGFDRHFFTSLGISAGEAFVVLDKEAA